MKKLFIFLGIILMCLPLQAKRMSDLKIYINPGHGGYDSDDRPIRLYPLPADSTNFWESKSNLYKGLHMYYILDSLGAKPYLSRIKNTTADDRSLSGIAAEANALGVDLFFSIHSNAGEASNYPLMLYRENEIGTPRYPENVTLSSLLWQNLHSNKLPVWTRDEEYICGDLTFYQNMWQGGLGVLRTLYVVGLLSEGGMHEHRPEAYRLMNDDYLWLEAWHFVKTIMEFYNTEDRFVTGNVAGIVYDDHNLREMIMPASFTKYGKDKNAPLNGATVLLKDASGNTVQKRTTDNMYNGVFVFRNVPAGNYKLSVAKDGYYSEECDVTVKANEVTYNDVPMNMIRQDNLKIMDFSPAPAEGELVSCASTIDFTFNFDVVPESFESAFSITPAVDGYFKYSESYHKASFIANLSLDKNTEYTVKLAKTVHHPDKYFAETGMTEDFTAHFKTKNRDRLALVEHYPAQNEAIHYQAPAIEVRFDKTLYGSTIKDFYTIRDEEGNDLAINARSCSTNTLTSGYGNMIIVLQNDLEQGKVYTFTVSGDLRDTENIPLTENLVIQFTSTDEAKEKEGTIMESFETASIFAGNLENSVGTASTPTYSKSTTKKIFGKAGGLFSYKFSDFRGGTAFWKYSGTEAGVFYDGDIVGVHVNGDFNKHDLYVEFTSGTDVKYFKPGSLDFRGWKYLQVKLEGLLYDTPYLFTGIKLVQVESPITMKGSFSLDNIICNSAKGGVELVEADGNAYSVTVENKTVKICGISRISSVEVYDTSGKLVATSTQDVVNLTDLLTGIYFLRIAGDGNLYASKIKL